MSTLFFLQAKKPFSCIEFVTFLRCFYVAYIFSTIACSLFAASVNASLGLA